MNSHNIMSFGLKMHIEWQTWCINTESGIYFSRRRRPTHEICDAVFVNMSLFSSILFWCYDPILGRCVSHVEHFFASLHQIDTLQRCRWRLVAIVANRTQCCCKVSNISCINIENTNNEIYSSFSADFQHNLDVRRKKSLMEVCARIRHLTNEFIERSHFWKEQIRHSWNCDRNANRKCITYCQPFPCP